MRNRTLYVNGNILTGRMEELFLPGGWLLVEGNRIVSLGTGAQYPEADREINLQGRIVMPGMVSTHCHFYGQFVRGMCLQQTISNWQQVLSRMWWKLDKALTEEQVYYSAMMGLTEGLKAGTTTYFDHHASPNFIDGSLDVIENAMQKAGARGCLAYEVSDRDGKERARQGIRENERFIRKNKSDASPFRGIFGLHASYTLSDETLELCSLSGNALQSGFHTHLAESAADVCDGYRQYDMHVTERMERFGILGDKTIAAHCVHLRPSDIEILRRTGTTVAHNCQSNCNNAVGVSPVAAMLESGVHVTLGGDGYTYNLFQELGFAIILQRLSRKDPAALSSERQLTDFTFSNGRRLAGNLFGYPVGTIEPGAAADFLILDYDAPTPVSRGNVFSHFTSFGSCIERVVVDGETVAEHGKVTRFDEAEIFARCREQAQKLWDSLKE